MLLQYQRFQLGGRIEEVEVDTNPTTGKQQILLRDVQDVFPTASRFERDGRPVRFLSDDYGNRLEPWRIAYHPETVLQVIPVREKLTPAPTPKPPSYDFEDSRSTIPGSPSILLPTQSAPREGDWREYLIQRAIRMAILVIASILTVAMGHGVSSLTIQRVGQPFTMVLLYWRAVSMVLFMLSLGWFLMLIALAVQVVWFLVVHAPMAARRSMYQRLFDF